MKRTLLKGFTVLVLGAGRFGAHYLRILSRLNADRRIDIPRIDRLALTRTRRDAAEALADQVRRDPECAVDEVTGFAVKDGRQLERVLRRCRPDLTCITAVDSKIGDALHAIYAEIVLKQSRSWVLSEKPLYPTGGDGGSLAQVLRLRRAGGDGRFGLELPMLPVRQQMEAHPDLVRRLSTPRRLKFFWSTTAPLRADLVDALAVHPWSLIPRHLRVDRIEGRSMGGRYVAAGQLVDAAGDRRVELDITLAADTDLRTLDIDDQRFRIDSSGARVSVRSAAGASAKGPGRKAGEEEVAAVENPLKINIIASLSGSPAIGLSGTEKVQRFLERIKGWTGS